jgi:hypothetical protein
VDQHLYQAAFLLQEDLNEAVATMTGVFILDGCQAGHPAGKFQHQQSAKPFCRASFS